MYEAWASDPKSVHPHWVSNLVFLNHIVHLSPPLSLFPSPPAARLPPVGPRCSLEWHVAAGQDLYKAREGESAGYEHTRTCGGK
jgi:hypothetical protein